MTRKSPRKITDAREARIQRQIASDPDAPEATDAQLAQAKPFAQAFPALVDSIKRSRGRPRVNSPKKPVTLRLDTSTLEKFQALGEGWRARMTDILDKAKP